MMGKYGVRQILRNEGTVISLLGDCKVEFENLEEAEDLAFRLSLDAAEFEDRTYYDYEVYVID